MYRKFDFSLWVNFRYSLCNFVYEIYTAIYENCVLFRNAIRPSVFPGEVLPALNNVIIFFSLSLSLLGCGAIVAQNLCQNKKIQYQAFSWYLSIKDGSFSIFIHYNFLSCFLVIRYIGFAFFENYFLVFKKYQSFYLYQFMLQHF